MEPVEVLFVAAIVVLGLLSAIIVGLVGKSIRSGTLHPILAGILSYLWIMGCVLIAVLLFLVFGALMGPFGIIAWFILIFTFTEGAQKYRASRQYGLLWLLTVSAERFMPLVPAIEAFAQERRGLFSRRAKRLAAMLGEGVSLPDALERCPGLLPRYAVPMIRVGHETGTLAHALRQAANAYSIHEPIWMAINGKIAYLLLLPVFGFFLLTFIMLKIVPSFEKIFQDFGTALPPMTVALIGVANFIFQFSVLFLPFYLLVLLLIIHVIMRYFGLTDADLPGISRMTRRLDSANILDALALVADRQQPLYEGIDALAQSYPKKNIRRRLQLATDDIKRGRDWCESLLWQGLIRRPEAAILQSAQRVGNLAWALREMAESVRRRLIYRLQAIAQVLFPPIVVLMGLVVMFIVVALFLPLISLIQNLS